KRQYDQFRQDGKKLGEVSKTTAGWDERAGRTVIQRRKEEVSDYRYFPEPDLVPVTVDAAAITRARAEMGELPAQQRTRLKEQYALSPYDVGVLKSQGRSVVAYFEEVAKDCGDAKAACNWIANKLLASAVPFTVKPTDLASLIREQKAMGLTKAVAEEVFD